MKKTLNIAIVLLNLLVGISCAANTAKFSNFILFGDSLSDVGNNSWIKFNGHIGAPIINMSKETQQRTLWIGGIMNEVFPDKKLYHSSQIQSDHINPLTDNVDYAWASAESGMHYSNDDQANMPFPQYNDEVCLKHGPGLIEPGSSCVPGVQLQVAQYLKDVQNHPNPASVFMFWIGGNDVINNLYKVVLSGRSLDGLIGSLSATVDHQPGFEDLSYPIINTKKAINALIDAGVAPDHIFVLDLPDPSLLPGILKVAKTKPEIIYLMHNLDLYYNQNLRIALTETDARYNLPPSQIYSTETLLTAVVNDPVKYGFQNSTEGCVDKGAEPYCEGYVFYNDKHGTVAVDKLLSDDISHFFGLI